MAHRLHLASSFAIACVIFYFGVLFTGQLPDHPLITGYNDLLWHAAAFGLLAMTFLPAMSQSKAAIASLFVFAGSTELIQLALPHRTASLLDLLASFAGIGIARLMLMAISELGPRLFDRKRTPEERING